MVKWLSQCIVFLKSCVLNQSAMSESQVHYLAICGDRCLSYRVFSLSDALGGKIAALLREIKYIWGCLKFSEVIILTYSLVIWTKYMKDI